MIQPSDPCPLQPLAHVDVGIMSNKCWVAEAYTTGQIPLLLQFPRQVVAAAMLDGGVNSGNACAAAMRWYAGALFSIGYVQ